MNNENGVTDRRVSTPRTAHYYKRSVQSRRRGQSGGGSSIGTWVMILVMCVVGGVIAVKMTKGSIEELNTQNRETDKNYEKARDQLEGKSSQSNESTRTGNNDASASSASHPGPSDEIITKIVEGLSTFKESGKYPDGEPYTHSSKLTILKIEHGNSLQSLRMKGIPVGTEIYPIRITWETKQEATGALLKCFPYNNKNEWPNGKNTSQGKGEWLFYKNEYGEWKFQYKP